jgi:hypothetical protein
MSGDTITGKIPVLFIVNSGVGYTRYFAQNGSKTIFTNLDITTSNTSNGFAMTTDITQPIITYNSSVQATIQEVKSITISKTPSDAAASMANGASSVAQGVSSAARAASSPMNSLFGSRTAATATAATAATANPTGYVIYGGSISGNLPVAKILGIRGANGNIYGKVYLAQDGPKVRAIITDTEYTRIYESTSFTMDLSKMTETEFPAQPNYPDFSYGRTPDSRYNIKKADGTGILTSS